MTSDKAFFAGGNSQTALLRADGTLIGLGDNALGQCNVSSWRLRVSSGIS